MGCCSYPAASSEVDLPTYLQQDCCYCPLPVWWSDSLTFRRRRFGSVWANRLENEHIWNEQIYMIDLKRRELLKINIVVYLWSSWSYSGSSLIGVWTNEVCISLLQSPDMRMSSRSKRTDGSKMPPPAIDGPLPNPPFGAVVIFSSALNLYLLTWKWIMWRSIEM